MQPALRERIRSAVLFGVLFFTAAPISGEPPPAPALTVTTSRDGLEPGTLRRAIQDANSHAGLDTITFNVGTGGSQSLFISSDLPAITEPVIIDGTTQPGFAGAPLITLRSSGGERSTETVGLTITGGGCTVRSLIIHSFRQRGFSGPRIQPGHGIVLRDNGGNTIEGCIIGLDPAAPSFSQGCRGAGIFIQNSPNNVIGGAEAARRNVIGQCELAGLLITGAASQGNRVLGNHVGLDASGTTVVENTGYGLVISNALNNVVGAGNVIAGNNLTDLVIQGDAASGNQVQGNWIGLRADGTALTSTPDTFNCIFINNASSNIIGGTSASARNVIAGRVFAIGISGPRAIGNVIQGNYIGTDPSGGTAIPTDTGIYLSQSVRTLVGGTEPGTGNLISGLSGNGVNMAGGASSNVVQGNLIGTDASGLKALPRTPGGSLSLNAGVTVDFGRDNLIGGSSPAARNVIVAHRADGIRLVAAGTSNNIIQGNYIGVAADGKTPLGNLGQGILSLGSSRNLIGGTDTATPAARLAGPRARPASTESPGTASVGNLIAHNTGDGVRVTREFDTFGQAGSDNWIQGNTIFSNAASGITFFAPCRITRNSIYGNGGLAIDRLGDGIKPNSPGAAHNFPVITAATSDGTSTKVTGTLNGPAGKTYELEFYANAAADPSGHGECERFLGIGQVVIGTSGEAPFDLTFPQATPAGHFVSGYATGPLTLPNAPARVTVYESASAGKAGDAEWPVPWDLVYRLVEASDPSQGVGVIPLAKPVADVSVSIERIEGGGPAYEVLLRARVVNHGPSATALSRIAIGYSDAGAFVPGVLPNVDSLSGLSQVSLPGFCSMISDPNKLPFHDKAFTCKGPIPMQAGETRDIVITLVTYPDYSLTVDVEVDSNEAIDPAPANNTVKYSSSRISIDPQLTDVAPLEGLFPGFSAPSYEKVTWTVQDGETTLNLNSVKVVVNDAEVPKTDLNIDSANGTTKITWEPVQLKAGQVYAVKVEWENNTGAQGGFIHHHTQNYEGRSNSGLFVIEAEDFNANGGQTVGAANTMPYAGGVYQDQPAVESIDVHSTSNSTGENAYRDVDWASIWQGAGDGNKVRNRDADGNPTWEVDVNYQVGWPQSGSWANYTRTVPEGTYTLWAAVSDDNPPSGDVKTYAKFSIVTSDPTQPDQTIEALGAFTATGTGGRFLLTPLRDAADVTAPVATVKLDGSPVTLRIEHQSGKFDYFMFAPEPRGAPGIESVTIRGGQVSITYSGTLQQADVVTGPYTDVTGATSPYSTSASAAQQYFRSRRP